MYSSSQVFLDGVGYISNSHRTALEYIGLFFVLLDVVLDRRQVRFLYSKPTNLTTLLLGFESSRGGYTYLVSHLAARIQVNQVLNVYDQMLGVVMPLYYTTIAQAVAAMSANAEIAAILFSVLFSFVLTLWVLVSV